MIKIQDFNELIKENKIFKKKNKTLKIEIDVFKKKSQNLEIILKENEGFKNENNELKSSCSKFSKLPFKNHHL